jgi:hypothetical protein
MLSEIVQAYADALYVGMTLRPPPARTCGMPAEAMRDSLGRPRGVLRRLLRSLMRRANSESAELLRPFCRSYGQLPNIAAGTCPLRNQSWQDRPQRNGA